MTPSPRSQEYQTIENGPTFATFEFSDSTGAIKNIRGRKVPKYPLDQRRSSSKLFQAMREGKKQPYCASINRISPSVVLAPGGHFGLGRRGHTASRHGIWHCDDRSSAG